MLQGFLVVGGAVNKLHSDASGQDAFSGAMVEIAYDRCWGSGSPQFAEEIEALLGFLS